jgi:hypothetical protein
MIPFEEKAKLTPSENYAKEILNANWQHVVRTTPGIKKDLEEKYPEISDAINRKIKEDTEKSFSNVFRTGVPDFLVFNDKGEYKFIEIKNEKDGLRHTQLKWLRDFKGINAETWFTTDKEVKQKLDTENISAYTLKEKKSEKSKSGIIGEKDSKLLVELPKTLASILELQKDDYINWRLKNKDELILDSK